MNNSKNINKKYKQATDKLKKYKINCLIPLLTNAKI